MISDILAGIQFVLSLFFFIIAFISFFRKREMKFAFFSVAMLSFLIESLILFLNDFQGYSTPLWFFLSFNVIIMVFLFLAMVR